MANHGTIAQSVGQGGKNDSRDVIVIQMLLRNTARLVIADWPPGRVGKSTIAAIKTFQKDVVKLKEPDGLISPGGATINTLTFEKLAPVGYGYYTYGGDVENKVWGLWDTLESIRTLAARVKDELKVDIGVSDISLRRGGTLKPHRGHQNGAEVDIRPIRTDGAKKPCHITWSKYDAKATAKMIGFLRDDPNTKKILFNDTSIDGVNYAQNHHHHLHVYFAIKSHPYSSVQRSFDMLRGRVERGLTDWLRTF